MTDPLSERAVLDVIQALVRVPSVNPQIAPEEAHGETAVAKFACDWLNDRGVRAWREEAAPGRPNAVGEVGDGHGPTLVFCAHLDTVGTAGMPTPFEPRYEGGRVYGRGAYDMKASAAAIMSAAAELARSGLRGRVLLALVADEEYASLGAADFVKRHPADACIVTEPSEGKLILAHKGFVWAEIVTTGRAAHGSRWDLGVSAIAKMGPIITAIERFDREELRQRVHPLVGNASMHCAQIQGGTGLSTYASQCTLRIERRSLPGETRSQVERELRDLAGPEASIDCFFDRAPFTVEGDARIVSCVRDAATEVTGMEPVEAGVGYWMDAAIFAAAGIPTVNIGPAGAGAHETVEWVDLESVVSCARILVSAARRFCS